jgi:DNA-binding NarL/FixJ family response regulator
MRIAAELERMQDNVATFADRVSALESSVATLRRLRSAPPPAVQPAGPLSVRELAILRLIAAGDDNGEIAESMHFGLGTIKLHVRQILEKLEVTSRTEAAVQGVLRGLI